MQEQLTEHLTVQPDEVDIDVIEIADFLEAARELLEGYSTLSTESKLAHIARIANGLK